MAQYKLYDLVRVKKQPSNQFVQLAGEIAVILEVFSSEPDYVQIGTLSLDGAVEIQGQGTVPIDCLEPADESNTTAPWRAAHAVWKQHMLEIDLANAQEEQRAQKRDRIKKQRLAKIAKKHGIKPEQLTEILRDVEDVV